MVLVLIVDVCASLEHRCVDKKFVYFFHKLGTAYMYGLDKKNYCSNIISIMWPIVCVLMIVSFWQLGYPLFEIAWIPAA
jgi:hypothetical protein